MKTKRTNPGKRKRFPTGPGRTCVIGLNEDGAVSVSEHRLPDGGSFKELLDAAMTEFVTLYRSGRLPPNLPIVNRQLKQPVETAERAQR